MRTKKDYVWVPKRFRRTKAGRPSLGEEARRYTIHIRLKPSEYEQLKEHCHGIGMSVSSFIRIMSVGIIAHKKK